MLNMKRRTAAFAIASVLVLCAFTGAIAQKEMLIAHGRTVLLELAPADPRSLMQGDYMRLRYKEAGDMMPRADRIPERGYAVLAADDKNIAHYRRLYNGAETLAKDEFLLHYHARYNSAEFVPDSFLFQEGLGQDFRVAKYGIFKVGDDGDSVLTGLADENRVEIVPKTEIKTGL